MNGRAGRDTWRRVRRLAQLAVSLVLLTAIDVVVSELPSHGATVRTALLLGDSITRETLPDFVPPSGWQLESVARSGIAPCDWLQPTPTPNLFTELATHPAAVIIETVGNDNTDCMKIGRKRPPVGSPGFVQRYEQALSTVISDSEAAGAIVVMLAPPPVLEPNLGTGLEQVTNWAHNTEHVYVATEPRLAVANHGNFTVYLPCLPSETAADGCYKRWIPVRMVNTEYHLHFCPYTKDVTHSHTCAVYSSGQERWATATMKILAGLP